MCAVSARGCSSKSRFPKETDTTGSGKFLRFFGVSMRPCITQGDGSTFLDSGRLSFEFSTRPVYIDFTGLFLCLKVLTFLNLSLKIKIEGTNQDRIIRRSGETLTTYEKEINNLHYNNHSFIYGFRLDK
jgi:hypothetical protein